jgi:hypothetical protein
MIQIVDIGTPWRCRWTPLLSSQRVRITLHLRYAMHTAHPARSASWETCIGDSLPGDELPKLVPKLGRLILVLARASDNVAHNTSSADGGVLRSRISVEIGCVVSWIDSNDT